MHEKKPKMIHAFTEAEVQEDLEKYRQMALDLGMTAAAIIQAEKIYVDKRVRAKCIVSKCVAYGCSAHCPPHGSDTAESGWEMYPIGKDANPTNVPHATLVGTALIE